MKKLLKTLLNNGFFVLALLIAVTLYLAYGQKQAAQNKAYVSGNTASEPTSEAVSASDTATVNTAEAETAPSAPPEAAPTAPAAQAAAETETPAASHTDATAAATDTQTAAAAATPENAQPKTVAAADTDKTAAPAAPEAPTTEQAEKSPETSPSADAASDQQPEPSAPTEQVEQATAIKSSESETTVGDTQVRVTTATETANGHRHSEVHVQVSQPATQLERETATAGRFDPRQINDRAILSTFNGPGEALAAAREAAHKGDYVWSAAIYSSLLKHYPRADLAGELGNVLWRMGEKQWAHRAWRYAAQLLIREGRIGIARTFARNIARVDAALSREIEAHLPKAESKPDATAKADAKQ